MRMNSNPQPPDLRLYEIEKSNDETGKEIISQTNDANPNQSKDKPQLFTKKS